MYYNTLNETGQRLLNFRQSAEAQATIVLAYFEDRPGQYLTPSDVWVGTGLEAKGAPIHSVRARITSLEKSGKLVKSPQTRIGGWGRAEHCWYYPGAMGIAA